MNYPLISEYIEAIKYAEDNFATLTNLRPVLGDDGNPIMSSGNFAVVFKMCDIDGKQYALKCFIRDQEGRNESYRMIADGLKDVASDYLVKIQYLEKEFFVDTDQSTENEFPVLLMDWVEGDILDKYIKNHISEPLCLEMLACDFAYFADWLLKQPFAHGDLKPDNILVKTDGSLVLIDYDGMFFPKMKGQKARELGSPDFRHPQRSEDDFDEHIDDFALVTILLSLKALSLNNNLLETFNSKDSVLLHKIDFSNFAKSAVNQKLQELICDKIFARIYALFVVILAEKVVGKDLLNMLSNIVSKIDINEVQYNYAQKLCDEGNGSEYALQKAFAIFEKLSKQNHVDGEICFSCCLMEGYGCIKNSEKGIDLIKYLAIKGNARAQHALGVYYKNGKGIEKNISKAVEWFTKAAEQGKTSAQFKLALCYYQGEGVAKDYPKAFRWFAKAAEQGDASSQYFLAFCYANGKGIGQDYQKAVGWYSKAAEQGHDEAQVCMGICYENGLGIKQDSQKAIEWYSKAAEQGNEKAKEKLNNLLERMKNDDDLPF